MVAYHNLEYNEARVEFKDMNIDERLKTIYSRALDCANNYCNENASIGNCDDYKRNNYKDIIWNQSKEYGYSIVRNYQINENEDAIKVSDKEWSSSFTYYILNKIDFSIVNISEEQFNNYYEQK